MKSLFLLTLFIILGNIQLLALEKKMEMTSASSAPMKDCTDTEVYPFLKDCFSKLDEANHAFRMIHKDPQGKEIQTTYAAVLVHGLSDSPYFFRDVSQLIFNEGINVIAIRTTGHGTTPEHLQKVKKEDWYQDIEWGKSQAKKYGKKIILGGMSLGGSLVVHNALKSKGSVNGLMLFSPALKIPFASLAGILCLKKGFQAEKSYGKGVRYSAIANNGVCQLNRVNKDIAGHQALEKPKENLHPITTQLVESYNPGLDEWRHQNREAIFPSLEVPIFNVLSVYDKAIDLKIAYEISRAVNSIKEGYSRLFLYSNKNRSDANGKPFEGNILPSNMTLVEVEEMRHASVLLRPSDNDFTPETNPQYDQMAEDLKEFIRINFK